MKIAFNPFRTIRPRRKMKATTLKPIRFNRESVALMLRIAAHFNSDFAGEVGEPSGAIDLYADLIAEGCPPSMAILHRLNLTRHGRGYLWNLQ